MRRFILFLIAFFLSSIIYAFECTPPIIKCTVNDIVKGEDFTAKIRRFDTNFKGENGYCYVQSRMAFSPEGKGIFTCSSLALDGMDVYSGLFYSLSNDFGKTWGSFKSSSTIKRYKKPDNSEQMFLDASPVYHKKTGKFLIFGASISYIGKKHNSDCQVTYSVFDESANDFKTQKILKLPYKICGAGCVQVHIQEDGSILLPVSVKDNPKDLTSVVVVKCSFDGEEIKVLEVGKKITHNVRRGVYEPSIIKSGKEYFLSLRNDKTGFIARSNDGLNYQEKVALRFDDGSLVGNYNTQTHWLENAGKIYLVYTRSGANNDHVFRHRAPLFVAEVDKKTLLVKRSTERAITANRGARMGNFGCIEIQPKRWAVITSEWMQGKGGWRGVMKHGANNSIYMTEIQFDK